MTAPLADKTHPPNGLCARSRDSPVGQTVDMLVRLVALISRKLFRLVILFLSVITVQGHRDRAHALGERPSQRLCRAIATTVRNECLDRVFILNERHLQSVLATYVDHYRQRPHRGLDLLPPPRGGRTFLASPQLRTAFAATIDWRLIHEYYREAA